MNRFRAKKTKKGYAIVRVKSDPNFEDLADLGLLTEENDHNPIVAATCPRCNGRGRWSEYHGDAQSLYGCTDCRELGVINEPVVLFREDRPTEKARPNAFGAVKCPGCGISFKLSDKVRWSGKRHRCGQKIEIED